jgi:hypothetical protein
MRSACSRAPRGPPDTAECCIDCNKACISNQVTVRPPRRRHPHRAKAGNELESPAIFRIAASRTRLRHPWPAQAGDLDADDVVRCLDRDRDRLAGGTRAAVPDAVDEEHAREQCCHVPARVPRAEHPDYERACDPRPLCSPRKGHGLPDCPSHQRNRPSLPAPARGSVRAAGRAHTGMHARLGGARQAGTHRQRGPSVAVRRNADGAHRPS